MSIPAPRVEDAEIGDLRAGNFIELVGDHIAGILLGPCGRDAECCKQQGSLNKDAHCVKICNDVIDCLVSVDT